MRPPYTTFRKYWADIWWTSLEPHPIFPFGELPSGTRFRTTGRFGFTSDYYLHLKRLPFCVFAEIEYTVPAKRGRKAEMQGVWITRAYLKKPYSQRLTKPIRRVMRRSQINQELNKIKGYAGRARNFRCRRLRK